MQYLSEAASHLSGNPDGQPIDDMRHTMGIPGNPHGSSPFRIRFCDAPEGDDPLASLDPDLPPTDFSIE
jgi:hypothetical protein